MTQPALLLVHGAWHGSWCWSRLLPHLEGLDVRTVDLPSAGTDAATLGDLDADAAVVRAAIEAIDGPVVVCAHSYGGMPVSEGAAGLPNVARLIYLCAFQLEVGESLASALNFELPDWQVVDAGGTFVDVLRPEEIFYADVEPAARQAAIEQLAHQSVAALGQPLTRAAWHDVASTYVICEQDAAIPATAQEAMAQRSGKVLRIDSSHSPFLSRPAELSELLRAELT